MADGFDWKKLIELAGPVVGGLVAKGSPGQTGFQSGWMQGQQIARQEKERKRLEAERAGKAGSDYLLKIGTAAQGFEDPVQFQEFLRIADMAGVKAGYVQPGELSQAITFPESKTAAKRLQELTDQLDALEKGGYNLDDLAESGAAVSLSDGTQVPIDTALELSQRRPMVGGKPVPKPKKQDTGAGSDYGRSLARFAKDKGKSVADLTFAEEQEFMRQRGEASRAAQDPEIAGLNKTLKELQVDTARGRQAGSSESAELTNEIKRMQIEAAKGKQADVQRADNQKRASALRSADDMTAVIDDLLAPEAPGRPPQLTPGAQAIVGVRMPFGSSVPGSEAANAKAALDRLVGTQVIDLMREMKEQSRTGATGFGQLSERELALLMGATTKLTNRNMSEAAFAEELKRIRDKVNLIYEDQAGAGSPAAAPGAGKPTHRFNPATGKVEPI